MNHLRHLSVWIDEPDPVHFVALLRLVHDKRIGPRGPGEDAAPVGPLGPTAQG
ncbi:hypothetical protein [Variovorax sp. J31P207]|uniref:hypothetical protein n=1 Tax=Variovorax sp. J31P207 TaxID=3053510 RepID=UPI002575463F|nr:hypothetical protein [Variovorax sp. J31P207]MDM0068371.1 hypothetical protein [Variovorax sp. J31P207]